MCAGVEAASLACSWSRWPVLRCSHTWPLASAEAASSDPGAMVTSVTSGAGC